MHSHDVRGLSMWPPYSPLPLSHQRAFRTNIAPLLVSGGLDMCIIVTPAALPQSATTRVVNPLATSVTATFGDAYHRRIAYSSGPHGTVGLHLAKGARLVLSTGDTSLAVWRLPKKSSVEEDSEVAPAAKTHGWSKVLEMDLQVQTNLVASAISDDGRWLAVSDAFETKLFSLRTEVRSLSVSLYVTFVILGVSVIDRFEAIARSRLSDKFERTSPRCSVNMRSFRFTLFS
jgi:U3 small nucleolar RNA-associated protein 4